MCHNEHVIITFVRHKPFLGVSSKQLKPVCHTITYCTYVMRVNFGRGFVHNRTILPSVTGEQLRNCTCTIYTHVCNNYIARTPALTPSINTSAFLAMFCPNSNN